MIPRPETKYARSGDVMVAYQVTGEGNPVDLVHAPGTVSHVEHFWDIPDGSFVHRAPQLVRSIDPVRQTGDRHERPPARPPRCSKSEPTTSEP